MQNDKQISETLDQEVVSLVEDVISLVVNGTRTDDKLPTICADEECGDSCGTSVCGYDADCDNDDNETVVERSLDEELDDDGYHSTSKPVNCDDNAEDNTKLSNCSERRQTVSHKKWICVGNTVLARWTDGLFYMGLIVQVGHDLTSL